MKRRRDAVALEDIIGKLSEAKSFISAPWHYYQISFISPITTVDVVAGTMNNLFHLFPTFYEESCGGRSLRFVSLAA